MTIALAVPDILVARAKSGDLEALEALYRAFETPVYNLALRVLRAPEDAEDVLQEAYVRAFRHFGSFRGERMRAWLLAIVRNACWSFLSRGLYTCRCRKPVVPIKNSILTLAKTRPS